MIPDWQRTTERLEFQIERLRASIRDLRIGLTLTAITAILCAVAIIIGE